MRLRWWARARRAISFQAVRSSNSYHILFSWGFLRLCTGTKKKEKGRKKAAITDALYSAIREHNALQSHPFAQLMNILI